MLLCADPQRYAGATGERRLDDDAHLFEENAHPIALLLRDRNLNGIAQGQHAVPLIRSVRAAVLRLLTGSLREIGEEGCHPVIPDLPSCL